MIAESARASHAARASVRGSSSAPIANGGKARHVTKAGCNPMGRSFGYCPLPGADRLRHLRAPRIFAGYAVVLFGIYGLVKILQPSVMSNDGLLCCIIPGLGNWLP